MAARNCCARTGVRNYIGCTACSIGAPNRHADLATIRGVSVSGSLDDVAGLELAEAELELLAGLGPDRPGPTTST
jgi:hypothetical protein